MRFRRRLIGAICIALALAATACGGDDGSPFPPFAATSPIEELLGVSIDPSEAAAWDDAISQIAITNCMAAEGIDYTPDPSLLTFRTQGVVPDSSGTPPELATIDAARTMLSFMTSEYEVALLPEADQAAARAVFDPNAAANRTPAERDAFWETLSGGPDGPGCLQASESAALGDTNRNGGLIAQFERTATDAYAEDAAVVAGAEMWRSCMAEAGYAYTSPGDAERQLRGQASSTMRLTDDEIDTGDTGSVEVQKRIIDDLSEVAAVEAEVAATSQTCGADWLAARAAVRAAVADDFVARFG